MTKQIVINLYDGVAGTLRTRIDIQCPYNILECPRKFRTTGFLVINEKTDASQRP